jgi:hypothetical protein
VYGGAAVDLGGGQQMSSRRWLWSPEGSARQLKVEGKNDGRRAPATNNRIARDGVCAVAPVKDLHGQEEWVGPEGAVEESKQ